MSNRINPSLKPKPQVEPERPRTGTAGTSDIGRKAKGIRRWFRNVLGADYLKNLNLRKNWLFILMLTAMVVFCIYQHLLTRSYQKQLELLDKERIELNDKYIQLMDQREMLYVDSSRQEALLEVFREKGFVDDSSIVYTIETQRKEVVK